MKKDSLFFITYKNEWRTLLYKYLDSCYLPRKERPISDLKRWKAPGRIDYRSTLEFPTGYSSTKWLAEPKRLTLLINLLRRINTGAGLRAPPTGLFAAHIDIVWYIGIGDIYTFSGGTGSITSHALSKLRSETFLVRWRTGDIACCTATKEKKSK